LAWRRGFYILYSILFTIVVVNINIVAKIRVRALPPIPTKGLTAADVNSLVNLYLFDCYDFPFLKKKQNFFMIVAKNSRYHAKSIDRDQQEQLD
jgi:hypothetical protein